MSLDINTEKGQISLAQEQELIAAIETANKGYRVVQTPKAEASDIDGFLCRGDVICAVLENKCRNMSRDALTRFGNEWLVTFEKINKGAQVAKHLKVPFIGYLYLVPDRKALSVRLTDKEGNFLPKIRLEQTSTQATINGGEAFRTNAFINMAAAKEVTV